MKNTYLFIGLDDNQDVKAKIETDTLYTSDEAWSMTFKLGKMFPELTFEYAQS
jgi:hypothetical protein